jgi:hypothetical protein
VSRGNFTENDMKLQPLTAAQKEIFEGGEYRTAWGDDEEVVSSNDEHCPPSTRCYFRNKTTGESRWAGTRPTFLALLRKGYLTCRNPDPWLDIFERKA